MDPKKHQEQKKTNLPGQKPFSNPKQEQHTQHPGKSDQQQKKNNW
jgi:hypothetical protein